MKTKFLLTQEEINLLRTCIRLELDTYNFIRDQAGEHSANEIKLRKLMDKFI